MPQEIERKYRVHRPPPDLDRFPSREIRQGYLAIATDGLEVRVRASGGRFTQTVKSGHGLTRTEVELEIRPDQFEELWPLTGTRRIRKTRYTLQAAGRPVDFDVYHDGLDGLMIAEVEFESEEESESFGPPAWMEEEVTTDERFKNRNLAAAGFRLDGIPDVPEDEDRP